MRTRLLTLLGAGALLGCNGGTGPERPNGTPPYQSFTYPSTVVPTGYQAAAAGQPGMTTVGVRLTNTGNATATIEYGPCGVAVWLYRDDQPESPPVWENPLPQGSFCIDIAYMQILLPGESYDVAGATLGSSQPNLPTGRYLVRVALKHSDGGTPVTAHLIVLDAGTIALVQ